ncbi:MAG TPA: ABC-2 family transporter protein [Acidobacteriota bacterium]|nr:ABC-2 family transporter protein [Acidobacteriota bacterium]
MGSVVWKFLRASFQAAISFRGEMLFGGISMLVTNMTFFIPIYLVAVKYGSLGGFAPELIKVGLAISMATFVIGINFFSGVRELQGYILNGRFDHLLLRPISVYKHILLARINTYTLGEVLTLIIFVAWNDPMYYPLIFVSGIIGGILFNHVVLLSSLTPFFFNQHVSHTLFDTIITSSIYPPTVFPSVAKFISLYVFMGGLVTYGGLMAYQNPAFWFVFIGFTVAVVAITQTLLHIGMKRYTSGGY